MSPINDAHVLENTESLCPLCLKKIPATIVKGDDGAVYMKKICPDHGLGWSRVWPDVAHYNWLRSFRVPFKPPKTNAQPLASCPYDCGLCAAHLRQPTLAEIEVTQRCNLRCPVCFVAAGEAPPDPSLADLRAMYETIMRQSGPNISIQLTGGEPTVRQNLPEIIRLGRDCGFSAIEINTNGVVTGQRPDYAQTLKAAGATGIYLQFDGLTGAVYEQIRGADLLSIKLQAIENCRAAGLQVVLAMTIIDGVNDDQIGQVLDFALANLDVVVGLALQPAFTSGRFDVNNTRRLNMGDVAFMLQEQTGGMIDAYDLWPLGCSHPLCSCATQLLVNEDGQVTPVTRLLSPEDYIQRYDPDSPQGSVFADLIARQYGQIPPSLSLVIMNYMDAMTLDLKRVRECSMVVTMEDGRLIPFCAYQLSDPMGRRLYPTLGRQTEKALL